MDALARSRCREGCKSLRHNWIFMSVYLEILFGVCIAINPRIRAIQKSKPMGKTERISSMYWNADFFTAATILIDQFLPSYHAS